MFRYLALEQWVLPCNIYISIIRLNLAYFAAVHSVEIVKVHVVMLTQMPHRVLVLLSARSILIFRWIDQSLLINLGNRIFRTSLERPCWLHHFDPVKSNLRLSQERIAVVNYTVFNTVLV